MRVPEPRSMSVTPKLKVGEGGFPKPADRKEISCSSKMLFDFIIADH